MKRLLSIAMLLLAPVAAQAGIAVATGTHRMSENSFATGNNNAQPDNYTGNSIVTISGTRAFSAYYTPSNAADVSIGALLYVYAVTSTTSTMTVNLTSGTAGTIHRATATLSFCLNSVVTNGPTNGWFFAKWATPHTYGDTTANQWRISAVVDTGNVYLRRNTGTVLAYVEVLASTKSIASGDSLYITGVGTVSGTISTTSVQVDISTTLGSASIEAISIGAGGELTWGDTQTSSCTLTLNHHIRVGASHPGRYGLSMGTPLSPLTSSYIQTLSFASGGTAYGIRMNDERTNSYQGNLMPPNIRINGNADFNLGGNNDNYHAYLVVNATVSTNAFYVNRDIGLRTGGGDTILVTGTTAANKNEIFTTTTYDPSTFKITISGTAVNAHGGSGLYPAKVYVMNSNAKIQATNASYNTYIYAYGHYATGMRPTIQISNFESQYLSDYFCQFLSTQSYLNYYRGRSSAVASTLGLTFQMAPMNNIVYHSLASITHGTSNIEFTTAAFIMANGVLSFNAAPVKMRDFYVDSGRITLGAVGYLFDTGRISGGGAWGVLNNTAVKDCVFKDVIIGTPVAHTTGDVGIVAPRSFENTFINPLFNSSVGFVMTELDDNLSDTNIYLQNYGNASPDSNIIDSRWLKTEGTIQTTGAGLGDTTVKTAGSMGLKMTGQTPTISTDDLWFEVSRSVSGGSNVTLVGYYKKGTYTDSDNPIITMESDDGVLSESYICVGGTDWNYFAISGVVGSTDTVVNIRFDMKSSATGDTVYFDDMYFYDGSPTAGGAGSTTFGEIWEKGKPTFKTIGSTVDANFLRSAVWSTYGTDGAAIAAVPTTSTTTITDAVWDEPRSNHVVSGTFGNELATSADVQNVVEVFQSTATDASAAIAGTTESGSSTNTVVRDGSYWVLAESAPGGDGLGVELIFGTTLTYYIDSVDIIGRYDGSPSHDIELYAYNWNSGTYELVHDMFMQNASVDSTHSHDLQPTHKSPTTGEVRIRLIHSAGTYTATHRLYIDKAEVITRKTTPPLTQGEITDAVWDASTGSYRNASTFGLWLQKGLIDRIKADIR